MMKHTAEAINQFIGTLPPKQRTADSATAGVEKKIAADWLLVTCIDCRYPHVVHEFMRKHHPRQLYDQLVLAGASLAATKSHTQRSHWQKTFLEHVGMSIDLHNIRGVLILDHRTCGAFKGFGLLTRADDNSDRE